MKQLFEVAAMSVHYFMWAWRTLVLMLLIAVVGELAIINRRLTAI